jgi:hypothetical protein
LIAVLFSVCKENPSWIPASLDFKS